MASEISLIDGTLILNGVEITGFGDSETAMDVPNVDTATVRRGADGRMSAGKTGNVGGSLDLMLLQNSVGFKFFLGISNAMNNGASIRISGLYRNEAAGVYMIFRGGILSNAPRGFTLGVGAPVAKSVSIEFQNIDNRPELLNVTGD